MRFNKYDNTHLAVLFTKQEAKEVCEAIDEMLSSADDFNISEKSFWQFIEGLRNLSNLGSENY